MKKFILLICLTFSLVLSSCTDRGDKEDAKWEKIVASAKGTELRLALKFDGKTDVWLKKEFAPKLKTAYGVELRLEDLRYDEIESILISHLDDENISGDIDLVLVNYEDFAKIKKQNLIYGPFTQDIPNFNSYVSGKDYSVNYANLVSTEFSAFPFNQHQLSYFYNEDVLFDPPEGLEALETYLKKDPGSFTYPNPKTQAGRAFVEAVILQFASERDFYINTSLSEAELRELVLPGLDYLRRIKNYLYGGGRFYPMEEAEYDKLFKDGEIKMTVSMNHRHAEDMVSKGEYPEYTRTFKMFPISTSVNDFLVIPYNSTNKSGALLALDYLLEKDVQMDQFLDEGMAASSAYGPDVSSSILSKMDDMSRKKTMPKLSKMVEAKRSRIPDEYWDYILKEWSKL